MKFSLSLPFSLLGLACCSSVLAAPGGTGGANVNNLFEQILGILQGASLVVVTIAVIWAGYKILFRGANLQEVAGPLLGAVLIGAAPWLAGIILGN